MIKEKKVLEKEEIKELQDLKSTYDDLIYALGALEAQGKLSLETGEIEPLQ